MNHPDTTTLFSPITLGTLSLPNRVVMAPMTRMACEQHIPGEANAAYYARRAAGGVGLIITECTFVDHPAANAYPGAPAFYGDAALAGWRKVVEAVHAAGGRILPQLWHAGPMRTPGVPPHPAEPAVGPVATQQEDGTAVVGMSRKDMEAVVQAFAQAAGDARSLGFDGMEIHGAHSFLIDQFLWAESNRRGDTYGGAVENRVRFAVDIVSAVRAAVGPDFPIVFRYSQWKQGDYAARIAHSPAELEAILLPLAAAGVDIFHPSTRRFWEPAFEDSPLSLAAWTRRLTGKPVIAVGSVGIDQPLDLAIFEGASISNQPTPITTLEAALARGEFDLVAVGRALLGDAAWANKIRAGQLDAIHPFSSEALAQLA